MIEVVSTNWRDDYRVKLNEYETLGILEYWIVDYTGLGGVQYIESPKQLTATLNSLIDGEYQVQRYQGDATIISPTFPQLGVNDCSNCCDDWKFSRSILLNRINRNQGTLLGVVVYG